MCRWSIVALAFLIASHIVAEDYLLRLEKSGYVDSADKEPKTAVLISLAVVVRPDVAFTGKSIVVGDSSLELGGVLKPNKQGGFTAELNFVETIADKTKGGKLAAPEVRASKTMITMELNKRVMVREETTAANRGGRELRSKIQYSFIVEKLEKSGK